MTYSFTIVSVPGAPSPVNNFEIQYKWDLCNDGATPNIRSELWTGVSPPFGSQLFFWGGSDTTNGNPSLSFGGLSLEQQAAISNQVPFTYSFGSGRYTIVQSASVQVGGIVSGIRFGSATVDPIIEVAPGFEQYYSIVYDEGVFIPEPGTMALTALGLLALGAVSRRGRLNEQMRVSMR